MFIGKVTVWKEVKGYEGLYEVSNQGHVKSLDRFDRLGRKCKGQVLKQALFKNGYLYVCLYKDGSPKRSFQVHRLVAKSFIANPENKPQVNHIDGDKTNNSTDNLEWSTRSENMRHAIVTGLKDMPNGEEHWSSKLTESQVLEIYIRVHKGETQQKLADEFKIGRKQISLIKLGKSWSWLTKTIAI